MKTARILAVAVLASLPALSFADTGRGVTRADVRAELIRLERAGYNPASSDAHYPDDVAAALQVVRSDQNGPSKSQGDNVADASAPAGRAAARGTRVAANAATAATAATAAWPADDLYAHS
ncbi:DUF4148 domain-containing protein [Burkholderia dolosa]|uniref:DUF4148 domain-containing protein n=1 Tax=Burkholderia dolosa TaxID=152500 RepID=A0A892IE68_9BURK|nr:MULTISPECIES: DUF4148 domain-containing protein [Burkholderia]AKE06884.1 hypothetical protein XM57_21140 [Burkholderia cepacia]AJY09930.1 hypothetical protein AK34_4856 [Burkholderia dolosa AU0158]AYZ94487.1 DUF4148 domain-containing protein [Burkholderia dolosa]ETP63476.1 hypothetical protein BDSB_24975 [Burkholderia dolosa PC543]MBR8415907.1 DUF4148 domain-containing protein [Burkholderia dolosa]